MQNKGFTLLEMIISISIISVLSLLTIPYFRLNTLNRYDFIYEYLLKQVECMSEYKREELITHGNVWHNSSIRFNSLGHINQAQTITIEEKNKYYEYIVELGSGRLVKK